jgi:hypothetical protein
MSSKMYFKYLKYKTKYLKLQRGGMNHIRIIKVQTPELKTKLHRDQFDSDSDILKYMHDEKQKKELETLENKLETLKKEKLILDIEYKELVDGREKLRIEREKLDEIINYYEIQKYIEKDLNIINILNKNRNHKLPEINAKIELVQKEINAIKNVTIHL